MVQYSIIIRNYQRIQENLRTIFPIIRQQKLDLTKYLLYTVFKIGGVSK